MKIHKILISLFTAVILCSCEKADDGDKLPDGIKSDLNFHTLEIVDVSYNSASLSVKHDGTSDDTWYGFVTDKIGTKDAVLIADKITELTTNGGLKKLDRRPSARIELTDLQAAKNYKYIVFAITADGVLYGASRSIQFKTEESAFLLTQCDDWSVAYAGRDALKNEEQYTVDFEAAGAPRCHIGFVPKWMVEYYEEDEKVMAEIEEFGGLRLQIGEQVFMFSIIDYLVWEELYEYWGYYEGDDEYFANDTFGETSGFNVPRQESGEYYAVAIGFKDGEPTFTYSVDEITIEKEIPSEEYNNWIGKWTLTGANTHMSYTLEFKENDPNFSYYVYGWECGESLHDKTCTENCTEHQLFMDFSEYELGIPFYFDALTGNFFIKSSILGGQSINQEDEDGNEYYQYWGLFGYTTHDNERVSILTPEDNIASAAQPVDSQTILNGLSSVTYKYGETENDVEKVNFTYGYLGYISYDTKNYNVIPYNIPVELPATMVKNAVDPVVNTIRKGDSSMRKEMAAKSFRNIKANDYKKLKIAR